jgi:hypothetical protein
MGDVPMFRRLMEPMMAMIENDVNSIDDDVHRDVAIPDWIDE